MDDKKQEISVLVDKVQQGDMDAFGKLYELVSPRSLFVALEIVKNKQDAEDILQDSFITALEKINTLDKSESFVGWFNRIVANKSKDFIKKKKPMLFGEEEKEVFELIPDEDKEFSPQENFNDNETRKMVLDAVNELSDEKRICVLLHYYNEMSVADIAQTVGANENTVKSRLFQARKDLSAKFKDLERKGLYGFSPIGIVLWAWRGAEKTAAESFIGSEAASTILASVTAKAGATAASTAAAGAAATAGTAATTTAAAVGSGAASTAAAGTGLVAKIAALTVAQKVVAGVAIAGVVTGSAAGTVAVVKNNTLEKSEATTTTVMYAAGDKVVTSSEWLETNTVTETTAEAISVLSQQTTKTAEKITEEPSCTVAQTTRKSDAGKTETQKPSQTEKKTRESTTRRDYSLNKTETSAVQVTTTAKPTTTKKQKTTTTEEQTAKTTTKKIATTKPTTTTTTTEATTTTTKPTTTEAPATTTTTLAKARVTIAIYNLNSDDNTTPIAQETFEVDAGTLIDNDYVLSKLSSGINGNTYTEDDIFMMDMPSSGHEMTANENYTINVNCLL